MQYLQCNDFTQVGKEQKVEKSEIIYNALYTTFLDVMKKQKQDGGETAGLDRCTKGAEENYALNNPDYERKLKKEILKKN